MTDGDGSDLTGDQRALRDTLRGFLVTELPTAALRATLETDAGYSPQLHTRLAGELGLAGLTIPGEFGGLGLSQAEACVVHTELGRALYAPLFPRRRGLTDQRAQGGVAQPDADSARHEHRDEHRQ